jgi:tetratricopeptide (TPR) repeat protein
MDKNKVIESAAKLIGKGQFDKAVKEYQRVLEGDPDDVRVLQKLAELYQKMQRKDEAADCFEKVARTYAAQGFYLKAVALYKQVLKVVERIDVNVKLAELYQQLGLVGDATKEWQSVAAFHEKAGDAKASLDTLRKLVDLDPDNVAARIRLGEQYARQEQMVEAVSELRRAATYLQKAGRQDDYLRVAERVSHLDQGDATLARELAESYLARGDSKRALAKLQICFKVNPRDLGTLQMLARAFQDLGQVSKTVSVLKELARLHADAGRADEAKKVYEQALELAPNDGELGEALQSLSALTAEAPAQRSESKAAPAAAPPARFAASLAQNAAGRVSVAPSAQERSAAKVAEVAREPSPSAEEAASSAPPRKPDLTPVSPASVPKLIKEAEVYVKYGLHDKALEHLRKIFSVEPENVEAHEKAKTLALAMNRPADAAASLATLVGLYVARSDPRAEEAKAELQRIDPGNAALRAPAGRAGKPAPRKPAAAPKVEEEIDLEPEPEELPQSATAGGAELEEIGEYVEAQPQDGAVVEDPVFAFDDDRAQPKPAKANAGAKAGARSKPAAVAREDAFASDLAEADFLIQAGHADDARGVLEGILLAQPNHPEASLKLSYLGATAAKPKPAPRKTAAAPPARARAVDDLAEELAAELAAEVANLGAAGHEGDDPIAPESLDAFQVPVHEVLGEFRAKVQETVRPEDAQTHYDLGIAYKEMELLEEAIAEFEVALRHGGGVRKTDCVTMLGVCAMQRNQVEKAIEWFQKGLAETDLDAGARRALSFELAVAYESMGETGLALEQYQIVERVEPGFRDVAARIVQLGGTVSGPKRVPSRPPAAKGAGEPAPAAGETQEQRRNRKIGFV